MSLGQTLTVIATVVTTMLAMYGIDAWRREHTGRRRIELAEETLALFYEAFDALEHIRNPGSFESEYRGLVRGENESDAQYDARRKASIVFVRFSTYSDLFNKIHAMRYRFMAQVGKSEAAPFEELRAIVGEIKIAANMLSRLWPRDFFRDEAAFLAHSQQVGKFEAIFGWALPDEDPVKPRLEAAISTIESTCHNIIAGRGSLFGLLNVPLRLRKHL